MLFQIADVSKPLVSVLAICERGNRVIFGRSGGVVKNHKTGKEILFYKKNGIYVLSLWLMDSADEDFARPRPPGVAVIRRQPEEQWRCRCLCRMRRVYPILRRA